MTKHLIHIIHSDKHKLAQQIGSILTQKGAISYSAAKDILDLCSELLGRSAVLEPFTPKELTKPTHVDRLPNSVDDLERLPTERCRAECYINKDGKLSLSLGMFAADNLYIRSVEIPFSDFAENFACLADFERLVIDLIHNPPVRRDITHVP